jgi:hypothetical protein
VHVLRSAQPLDGGDAVALVHHGKRQARIDPAAIDNHLLAGAKTTHENAFKLPLVERALDAVLAEARG